MGPGPKSALWFATAYYCLPQPVTTALQVIQQEYKDGSRANNSVVEMLGSECQAAILSAAQMAADGLDDQAQLLAYEVAVMFNVQHLNIVQVGVGLVWVWLLVVGFGLGWGWGWCQSMWVLGQCGYSASDGSVPCVNGVCGAC